MTLQLLAKPTRPQAPAISSTMTVIQDVWPDNRELLKPLWGKPVCITGTVGRASFVEQRSFLLVKHVTIAPAHQRYLSEAKRDYIQINHSWMEITDDSPILKTGVSAQCMAVVIKYTRADGSESFGFRLTRAAHPWSVIQSIVDHASADINRAINANHSPTHILQSILNYAEQICREGVAKDFRYLKCTPAAPVTLDPGPEGMNFVAKDITHTIRKWIKASSQYNYNLLRRHIKAMIDHQL